MTPHRVPALVATLALLGTPALARATTTGHPTAGDARQLQLVARYANELSRRTAGDQRYNLADMIDVAWNSVSKVYIPLDARATFPGGQAEPFSVMQARMSVLNSTVDEGAGVASSAEAVAEWAHHLLQTTENR